MIVVDANVAAKWYLPEISTEAALELMDSPGRLFAPDLIRLEVLAAVTRCVRTGEAGQEETQARCRNWLRHLGIGAITLVPEADLLDEALNLSLEIKHNLQDCLYLAAAQARCRAGHGRRDVSEAGQPAVWPRCAAAWLRAPLSEGEGNARGNPTHRSPALSRR